MKKSKGITLIALIITIIVLLILAGVSISIMTGDNGVLSQAQESKEKTDRAHIEEMKQLTASRAAMNLDGYTYTDKKGVTVYIPSSFAVSENPDEQLVEDGLVVIDKYGDEFVWVPVEADGKDFVRKIGTSYKIKAGVGNNSGSFEIPNLRDDFGDHKLLKNSKSGGIIDGTDDKEFKIVTNAKGFFVSRYEIGIESIDRGISIADYMERVNSDNDADYYLDNVDKEARRSLVPKLNSKQGMEPIRQISQLECFDLANAWKSGNNYQSGLMSGRTWDRMVSFICNDSSEDDEIDENLPTFKKVLANSDSSSWGNYGLSTKSITYKKIFTSNDEGADYVMRVTNFSRTQLDGTERYIFPTGEFISDKGRDTKMKNVYDVAGNVWEWTTEESHYHIDEDSNYDYRIIRGGSVGDKGEKDPASRRNGNKSEKTGAYWHVGFRVVLYVLPSDNNS